MIEVKIEVCEGVALWYVQSEDLLSLVIVPDNSPDLKPKKASITLESKDAMALSAALHHIMKMSGHAR